MNASRKRGVADTIPFNSRADLFALRNSLPSMAEASDFGVT
jgi:hypothetical protein